MHENCDVKMIVKLRPGSRSMLTTDDQPERVLETREQEREKERERKKGKERKAQLETFD